MGPPLAFVPFEGKRQISLGDHAKRVEVTPRSPSPPPSIPSTSITAPSLGPRRIQPTLIAAAQKASTSSASSSEGSDVLPKSPAVSSVTSVTSAVSSTPSRKGKEREVPAAEATPKATPKATPNGPPSGTPNGSAKKTPKAAVKALVATPKGQGIFPASDVDLSWPAAIQRTRAAGLHNGSMACYTNATLQVLLHTPPVLHIALAHRDDDCPFTSRRKFCMLCALRKVMTEDHWAGKKRAYRPTPIHQHLGQIKKGFSRNRQEDAHEFFRFVTDALQNTCLAGKPKDLPEKVKRTTWVYRTWGGMVRSRVLCLSCKKPSDTFDSFLDLSLDMPKGAKSVDDLFKQFVHIERLDGDNKYHCDNCKRKSAATKQMKVAEAPPILTLHLKRFGYSMYGNGRMTKVNNLIEYPGIIDIGDYMVDGAAEGTKYKLFGVTCHHGGSMSSGHYTSYVKGPEGQWYNADDDDVSQVRRDTVLLDRSAYLLSYMRMEPGVGTKSAPGTPLSAPSTTLGKRARDDDDSPASTKRVSSPPSAVASKAGRKLVANGTPALNGKRTPNGMASSTPALGRLANHYASSEDEDERAGTPPPERPFGGAMGSPKMHKGRNAAFHSPPRSPKKSKFHNQDPKRGLHGVNKKSKGAPMPFATGQKRKSGHGGHNMRTNGMMSKREMNVGRKKGVIKRMQGRA